MAKTAIQPNRQRLEALVEIIDAVLEHPLPALQRAALCFCALTLRSMTTPPQAPAAAASQAAPPAAPVLTITEVDGPTPPIRAHAHDAAVKAAATRKANKQKSAGTAEKIGADTKAPEPSDEPAVTE
jgi:hypothetical protein